MKQVTKILVFYSLYSFWLLAFSFLSYYPPILTHFVFLIVIFYFLFLRERGDIVLFTITVISVSLGLIVEISGSSISLNFEKLSEIPYWLPIAWGATVMALRKFFLVVNIEKRLS